jgi:hypothetical protein
MNSTDYIKDAIRTESVPSNINMNEVGLASILKLGIFAAQVVDLAKRKVFYGKDIPTDELKKLLMQLAEGSMHLAMASETTASINDRMDDPRITDEGFNVDRLNVRLLHAGMGCFTESGELLEALFKQITTGELDLVNFGEEIGDIEWYQAIGFDETGVTEALCREKNIAKLKTRYPEKFDADQAVNRDLAAERNVLEDSFKQESLNAAVRQASGQDD